MLKNFYEKAGEACSELDEDISVSKHGNLIVRHFLFDDLPLNLATICPGVFELSSTWPQSAPATLDLASIWPQSAPESLRVSSIWPQSASASLNLSPICLEVPRSVLNLTDVL